MADALADLEAAPAPRRRRRRGWGWLIALLVVVGLAVAAWFVADAVVRPIVADQIRDRVRTELSLPADQQIDVEVGGGPIIPQLVSGVLDTVTISSDDLPLGPTTGDVTVRASGIPIRGEPVVRAAQGTVVLGADEVSALLATSPDLAITDARFQGTDVAATLAFTVLGASIPVDVVLTPRAEGGALVLSPVSYSALGATFDADQLRDQFGDAVSGITDDRTVCLAGYLPTGLSLQHIAVQDETIQAQFAVDPEIATDPALQATGSCG